jgi:hypothetical protein
MAPMEEGIEEAAAACSYTDEVSRGGPAVLEEGKTVSRVREDLDLSASALASWVK